MDAISSTITDEFLTCSICLEIYKDPKILPCLHSFCKTCIENFIRKEDQNTKHSCPLCRENFKIPNDSTDALKTNFCLKNLIELVTSGKQEVTKLCSFCTLLGKDVEASAQCLTCKDLLCSECADHRHRSTRFTLHHRVVTLAEVKTGKYNDVIRSKQQIPCSEHTDEDLRYFCDTCDVPICRDCIVLSHQGHKYIAPKDARERLDDSLGKSMSALKENLGKLKFGKENVEHALNQLEDEKQKFKEDLEKQFDVVVENIRRSKKSIENDFDRIVKSRQESLHRQGESIENENKKLGETVSFCSNILSCGSDIEILTMKTELNERLAKFQSLKNVESCKVKELDLPTFQINTDGKVFGLSLKERKGHKGSPNMGHLIPEASLNDNAKMETDFPKFKENENITLPLYVKSLQTLDCKEKGDKFIPSYTSVAWIDKETCAVVDQTNQKLKFFGMSGNDTKSMVFPECLAVSPFKDGISYHTTGRRLIVLNNSMVKEKEFSGVSTLLTCHSKSQQVSWISGFDKICVYRDKELKEMPIKNQHTSVKFGNPMFGHVLLNGMFIVSDCARDCIFIIQQSGSIERRKYCSPGAVSSDMNNRIYVCDYRQSLVVVFTVAGETLRTYKIAPFLRNPRSIAVNTSGRTLISNGRAIILAELI
ncbi:E3 ubiquitin-protein ligase TRIM56-like [Ostrea edulis]|uniref:E3 ubiquitin-protein ligase TRIM56-like n=1 Tax=Ostrea edulis TaxID=37623 RepID=UPI0024AF2B0D|nr:E3 ubiquitin-protein ligase TRIM56-like [Ostrea edulis]